MATATKKYSRERAHDRGAAWRKAGFAGLGASALAGGGGSQQSAPGTALRAPAAERGPPPGAGGRAGGRRAASEPSPAATSAAGLPALTLRCRPPSPHPCGKELPRGLLAADSGPRPLAPGPRGTAGGGGPLPEAGVRGAGCPRRRPGGAAGRARLPLVVTVSPSRAAPLPSRPVPGPGRPPPHSPPPAPGW